MKYRFLALLIGMNLTIHATPPEQIKSATMHSKPPPNTPRSDETLNDFPIPTCGQIIECLGCCCEAMIVIGLLSFKYVACKNKHREYPDKDSPERHIH